MYAKIVRSSGRPRVRASLIALGAVLSMIVGGGRAAAAELVGITKSTPARASASASAASRGTAMKGDTYPVSRKQGDWVEVQFDDRKAWLKRSDVALRDGALKRATAVLNVRSGPSTAHAAIGTLPKGARVAERGGSANATWRKISFRGKTGWVFARYLASEQASAGRGSAPDATGADRDGGTSATGSSADAWENGRRIGPIDTTTIDGKPVAQRTADAFLRMREAASRDGVPLRVVSGFRSYDQQAELYRLYRAGRGSLAAPPGQSNHQNGRALDLNTSTPRVASWLNRNAPRFGFRRTVPSEPWHWELR